MRCGWSLWFGTVLTTTALTSGCTTPTLFGPRSAAQSATSATSASPVQESNASSALSSQANSSEKLVKPAQSATTSTSEIALASLLQAGKSVSNALKIQPKISPFLDPVKLDNQPANSAQVAADLHYHAGFFRENQQDYMAAAAHYREVLQKSPNDVRALAGYGRVQDQMGNTVEAEDYLRRACELAPRDPALWNDLAQSHLRRGNLDMAIRCQEQTVTLQSTNGLYRAALAKLLVATERPDEAVLQLAAVHGDAMAHFQVACLLHERQATDLARVHLQKSLELNPSLAPARQMLDRWQMAVAGLTPNRPDQTASSTRLPAP
jgi:tetratricopeptide (TPR) repeat protein